MTSRTRRPVALVSALALTVTFAVTACSSGRTTQARRSSTTVTATSVPTPSTVSDADFDKQAQTAELMIRTAGTDPCAVIKAFGAASTMPTPTNAGQTERVVKLVAGVFDAAASSAPADVAADAPVLKQAAADLIAEGEANKWQPKWVMSTPKSLTNPKVTQAFTNYQAAVTKSCMAQTTTTSTP